MAATCFSFQIKTDFMETITTIGYVQSEYKTPTDPFEMKEKESIIIIDEKFEEGLYDIESSLFLDIIFVFHKSEGYKLRHLNYYKEDKGVFASRSPSRPSSIGHTTVKLIERKVNVLRVKGLDAIDGTPVIDIKPTISNFYEENSEKINTEHSKQNPRWEITQAIKTNNLEYLLLEAGKIHGHFCVGLAMGVRAAAYAMQHIHEFSDGMEDLVAITETNNCSADGVQFVTGCSFGNNALVFKDFGKTAFSLVTRNGKGIRIITRNDSRDYISTINAEFYEQFRKVVIEKNHDPEEKKKLRKAGSIASFKFLELDFDKIFKVEKIETKLPEYAPIHDSIICDSCGENTMATRIVKVEGKQLCLNCHAKDYKQLDGHGIHCIL